MKHQKVQSETTKRSTRETRAFAKTEHQQAQSESTNEAPENTIRDHKRSTRETRGFAKTEHQQAQETRGFAKTEHRKSNQRAQRKHQKETIKGATERPDVLPKRSTSKYNQRA